MIEVRVKATVEYGTERLYYGGQTTPEADALQRLLARRTLDAGAVEDLHTLGFSVVCVDCETEVDAVRIKGSGDAFGRFFSGMSCSMASVFDHARRQQTLDAYNPSKYDARAHQRGGIAHDKPGQN